MSNNIILPAKYDTEITIVYDSVRGQTELRLKKPMNQLILIGLLMEHAIGLMRKMISGAKPVDQQQAATTPPNGGTDA